MFVGKPNPEALLAFDINYSWLGIAIGLVRSDSQDWLKTLKIKITNRPCLCIHEGKANIIKPKDTAFNKESELIAQAGPTLIYNSRPVFTKAVQLEEFRADVIRKTDHVAIGCTPIGKIVALWAKDCSIADLTQVLLDCKCSVAMKCDGGSASAFWFNNQKYGKASECKAGVEFLAK